MTVNPQFKASIGVKKMFNFKVPAAALECARLVMGNNDVRSYLNGVRVNGSRISGTNGHVMYDHHVTPDFMEGMNKPAIDDTASLVMPGGDVLLKLKKPVPVGAYWAHVTQVSEDIAIVTYGKGHPVGYLKLKVAQVIDRHVVEIEMVGNYPNLDSIRKKIELDAPVAAPRIGFNAGYLAKLEKMASRINGKSAAVTLVLHGQNMAAHSEIKDMEGGVHYVVVMPMRTEE